VVPFFYLPLIVYNHKNMLIYISNAKIYSKGAIVEEIQDVFRENERNKRVENKMEKYDTLDDLFSAHDGNYIYHEIDTGDPVGNEKL